MIQSKNFNEQSWREVYSYSKLPKSLEHLNEMAHNLWWVWDKDARSLFEELNPKAWHLSSGNPVKVLSSLSPHRLEQVSSEASYLDRLNSVYSRFRAYMDAPMCSDVPSVAYFSMEYGLTNVLKIYSGGLGVLAGDYLKEASDSRIDMVGIGFLYRHGYFDQVISNDGQQVAEYTPQNFKGIPVEQVFEENGSPMILEVPFKNHTVYANIWRVNVGRVPLYLMDTDLPQNSEWDRPITYELYGGDWENRMKQEYLLGIGGVLLLDALGIRQKVYHYNEGHAAFVSVQRLINYIEKDGMSFDEALEVARASSLYTVHTPVAAGHDYFDEALFAKYMDHFPARLGISFQEFIDMGRENPGSHDKFSMSVFALNTAQEANGVSKLHGKVSQKMFSPVWKGFLSDELHVGYVTNGVHFPTWTAPQWSNFINKYISKDIINDQAKQEIWEQILEVPDAEIWEMRKRMKQRFIDYLKVRYDSSLVRNHVNPTSIIKILDHLNPNALLVGFGRRFATYKRAHLLFTDLNRLYSIVNDPKRPVQFIFTGKAHPADGGGQGLIKQIIEISKRPEFEGKILFIENYDIRVAQRFIPGVDVWLNTPTRPLEASGTSGMKATMNGVLNYSVLDGWWYEGYVEGGGWALTDKRTYQDQGLQDQLDAATIYRTFEDVIIPLFFDREEGQEYSKRWVKAIKTSMSQILPHFTMKRMIEDYNERFYTPLAKRSEKLAENNFTPVRDIVAWKKEVSERWEQLEVLEATVSTEGEAQAHAFMVGEKIEASLKVDMHELASDLVVELVIASPEQRSGDLTFVAKYPLSLVSTNGTQRQYYLQQVVEHSGALKVALRVTPTHALSPHQMDFAYLKWVALS